MLAEKDIDAALALIDEWEAGDKGAKARLAQMAEARAAGRGADGAMKTYPSITSPDFHQRLQRMRAFYTTKLKPESLSKVEGRVKALLPHQQFVNAYMAPGTGYNGMLLVHDVGVGKTCTAVSVAETYHAVMAQPTIVLTSAALKRQWKEEIVGVARAQYVSGAWTLPPSCAGSVYDRVGRRVTTESRKVLDQSVQAVVKTRYEFYGYIEFNNKFNNLRATGAKTRERLIRDEFSDRVIIVDEAHHLRSDKDAIQANAALRYVVRHTANVKLLLLTATPMFDRATEIVNLLNLLRSNDGRTEVREDDLFGVDGVLKDAAALAAACKGYVSYARGDDPETFPTRLTPSVSTGAKAAPWPASQSDGTPAAAPDLRALELVPSQASSHQEAVFTRLLKAGVTESGDAASTGRQMSAIAYPADANSVEEQLRVCLSGTVAEGGMEYRGDFRGMFGARLQEFSPKIATVLRYLRTCVGVAMVYSFWIAAGVLPVAFALEEAGYARVEGPPLLKTGARKNGKTYAIVTANGDLSPEGSRARILAKLKDPRNADGSLIAVVLVTQTVSEGVDLKNIREVHILEPWWNMGRPDQIIGRAARFLSHATLPAAERNVTVYNHVCELSGNRESVDHVYVRRALEKRGSIADVLGVLRAEAVDCAFNRAALYRKPAGKVVMQTSQGRTIQWALGDTDYSKACLYRRCVPSARVCSHDHLLAAPPPMRGHSPRVDEVSVVQALLEYEYNALAEGATPLRLTFADMGARLSEIPRDLLAYAVDRLIETRARFLVAATLCVMHRVADVYHMVPVGGKLIPLSSGVEVKARVVELTRAEPADAVASKADCEIDAEVDHFLADVTRKTDAVVRAAVDAVVDRKSHAQMVALARCGRSAVLASMRAGGYLSGNVVSHRGKGYDLDAKSKVAPVRPAPPAGPPPKYVCRLKGRALSFMTSNRGKSCNNMSNLQVAATLRDADFFEGDAGGLPKRTTCRLAELHYRVLGTLLRPGHEDAT
jgi:hypothetical protein